MTLKIYIDTSVYNRPFDDQTQPRIWLETQALFVILQMIEVDDSELVSSSVLDYENSRNPLPQRQQWVSRCLQLAKSYQPMNEEIRVRGQELETEGLGAIDALHLACAEATEADYFLTCDDRLIRRYQGKLQVLNPVNFIVAITGEV